MTTKKTVLVTGSSKGIGAETIKVFASHGYNVVINYNNDLESAIKLEKYVKENYNVETLVVKTDISNENEVKKMVEEIIGKFGTIDCLVNNAGIAIDTLFEDKTIDNFRRTLDVNLIGPFLVSRLVGEIMYNNKKGSIINVSSTNGIDTCYPMSVDYDASKAGLISLTHNLAIQYKPYVRVNCVAPGWVNTDMNKELEQEFIDEEKKQIFLDRFAEPIEIANVIYFLASDNASYVNNTVIRIDGGF